jgi:hypothetical protein
MKNLFCVFAVTVFFAFTEMSIAQIIVPQAFNYQAMLRNNMGVPMSNQNLSLRFSIIRDSLNGTIVYIEKHDTITNQFGAISVEIGRGIVLFGAFDSIYWGYGNHYLKTEIDTTGTGTYAAMGISQLISVPYAMYAQYAGPWQFSGPPSEIPPSEIWFIGNQYTSVGIGTTTPDPSAIIDASSNNQGVLFPRLSTVQRVNIVAPASGLIVYDIDFKQFWYFDGTLWNPIVDGNSAALYNHWIKTGNNLYYNSGNVGIGTATPQTPLQVSSGDVYIENIGSGVIMKSPNGNCWRMTVDNSGNPVFTVITCP